VVAGELGKGLTWEGKDAVTCQPELLAAGASERAPPVWAAVELTAKTPKKMKAQAQRNGETTGDMAISRQSSKTAL
jgi:hypothetical protein